MSNLSEKQYGFWTKFREYLFKQDIYTEWRRPLARNSYCIYMMHKIPKVVARINLFIDHREEKISCSLYIDKDKSLFAHLRKQKKEIEKEIKKQLKDGESIEWKYDSAENPSSIIIHKNVPEVFDAKKHDGYFSWFYRKNKILQGIFKKYSAGF